MTEDRPRARTSAEQREDLRRQMANLGEQVRKAVQSVGEGWQAAMDKAARTVSLELPPPDAADPTAAPGTTRYSGPGWWVSVSASGGLLYSDPLNIQGDDIQGYAAGLIAADRVRKEILADIDSEARADAGADAPPSGTA